LAHHLVETRCYDAALEQFMRIGPWCGAKPWAKHRHPAAVFDLARAIVATRSRRSRCGVGLVEGWQTALPEGRLLIA
jgi:hypothetical protein